MAPAAEIHAASAYSATEEIDQHIATPTMKLTNGFDVCPFDLTTCLQIRSFLFADHMKKTLSPAGSPGKHLAVLDQKLIDALFSPSVEAKIWGVASRALEQVIKAT